MHPSKILFSLLLINSVLFPQLRFSNLSGSVNLTSDYYHASGDIENRQQENLFRTIIRLSFNIHPEIKLPFEVYYSSMKNSYQQPFNQFGINPEISDWMILHGGYFSSRISDLTFGDMRILGGGVELRISDFKFKLLYGITKKAIAPDTNVRFPGTYKQTMYAFTAGYGDGKSSVNLNIFHAIDDANSITISDTLITPTHPAENIISSVDFGIPLSEFINVKGEAALSAFTNDTRGQIMNTHFRVPKFFFTTRNSSQADGAAKIAIEFYPSKFWSVKLLSKWIGPGYQTLGYSWLQNDIFDISAEPAIRLLNSRINLRGQIGFNRNNLRYHHESTTRRFNGRISIYAQILSDLGLDIQFINNQIRLHHNSDQLRVSNVFNNISVTPNYIFNGIGGINTLSINYSYQNTFDRNPSINSSVQNKTTVLNGIYTIRLSGVGSFSTNILSQYIQYETTSSRNLNFSETVSGSYWNNRFNLSVNFEYRVSKINVVDKKFLITGHLSYSLMRYGIISLNITNNNFNGYKKQSEDIASKIKFNELQLSLNYSLIFQNL